jgi:hypothetical protein
METHKPWYTSKTLWLNVITLLVAILSLVPQSFELEEPILKVVLFLNAVLNIVMRFVSGQPIIPANAVSLKK